MSKATVLVIDDDRGMRVSLAHLLENAGYEAVIAKNAHDGLEAIHLNAPDAILSDVRMPEMDGLEFQRKAREISHVPVILFSAHGDIPMAVSALQDGAYSFVEKPFEPRRLLGILKNAIRMKRLEDSTKLLQSRLAELTDLERILIGNSAQIIAVRDLIFDFAVSRANVLILGDTGTGKELVARALHDLGTSSTAPFVPINCAAIPPERFEETVFGTAEHPRGLMSEADGGTLFLDELTSMPSETQAKILRAIETKQYQRVGETEVQKVEFRVISAASGQMSQLIAEKTFREDLLFRLNTLVIKLPSLADRGEDVLLLLRHYMQRLSQIYELPVPKLTNDDISALMSYDWPGNVRELQNVAERRVLAERRGGGSVRLAIARQTSLQPFPGTLREAVAAFERELIGRAIQEENGRMDDVASTLGIGRRTLNEKIVKLDLDKDAILNS
ncbi:sigma-54-dependent Fis family transcriptional regulator [Sulfitobacter sp. SK012]|uniref:sigma-54-dependent transcriptional regulator n=1 Tax=Sulfitobacter sp. SK012 TaxID=1389005 RepID=UPI000E0B7819|nr:sigma-54 dependent transcriptional regulator [Sulfitobacter sp. SK012]AXI48330.1 sigma-54-dependent Fis family transcriptional regulator [Sulfitobacter sp. SK012]